MVQRGFRFWRFCISSRFYSPSTLLVMTDKRDLPLQDRFLELVKVSTDLWDTASVGLTRFALESTVLLVVRSCLLCTQRHSLFYICPVTPFVSWILQTCIRWSPGIIWHCRLEIAGGMCKERERGKI